MGPESRSLYDVPNNAPLATATPNPAGSSGGRAPSLTPTPLSVLIGALAANTLDSLNFGQIWNWSTLNTQTALALTVDAITSGKVLAIGSAATAFTGRAIDVVFSADGVGNTGTLLRLAAPGPTSAIVPLNITNLGVGLSANIQGAIALRAGAAYTTIGVQNDVQLANASWLSYTGAGAATFTGLAGGSDGRIVRIVNNGTGNLTITNDDVASAAANRILTSTGKTLVITVANSVLLTYDSTTARWRVVGVSIGNTVLTGQSTIAIGSTAAPAAALGPSYAGAHATATIEQAATDATLKYIERVTIDGGGNLVVVGGPANATAAVTVTWAVYRN